MKFYKSLDILLPMDYFVNIMNNIALNVSDDLLRYQAGKLQSLIREMVGCCQDRNLYEAQKFELPYAEINCLLLFNGERYLTVKNMARKLDVAKSRVTKLIENLKDKGLLESIGDPKDGRIKLISLTPAGLKKLEEINVFHEEIHRNILLQLELDERMTMLSFLERLRSAMEAVKESFV